jgi:hypothetical protein
MNKSAGRFWPFTSTENWPKRITSVLSLNFERLVRQDAKRRVLLDLTGFHGWDAGACWDDIKFNYKHSANIGRLAMVGDKKWRHGMATFCKSFAKATTRHFGHADAAKARQWLGAA